MPIRKISVERFSVISKQSFESVTSRLEAAVGHPDIKTFVAEVTSARSFADLERFIQKSVGASGMMEFIRFDIGAVLRKESGSPTPRIQRFVIGNPLIMKQMAKHVPDAASYAPVTVLIDERPDGVHLSYDRMASFLASYENAEAIQMARDLDAKIEALLAEIAR